MTATSVLASAGWRGVLQVGRRLGWGVTDQAASSISNFALGLYVARNYGATGFGVFSLVFITYTVILNASRGVSTDPMLVRFSGADVPVWRQAARAATATALGVGVAVGLVCLVIGLAVPGAVGSAFVALAVGLPGLMLQDSWRFAFFAAHRPQQALLNDIVWSVFLIAGMFFLYATEDRSIVHCLLIFGATAYAAAIFGILQSGLLPRPELVADWLREHRQLSSRYLLENVSSSGSAQVKAFVLGAAAGVASVGYVRGAEILMGPFVVVLAGISQVSVPEASRVFHRSAARLTRFALALGGAQAVAAAAWGLALLLILPLGPGKLLLGDIWEPASHLIVPVTLNVGTVCFLNSAMAGLRAMGVARRSMQVQLSTSAVYVVLSGLGAAFFGASGACWGAAAANALGTAFAWVQLRSAIREHQSVVAAKR